MSYDRELLTSATVNSQPVPKTEWKQTNGQTDGDDCITSRINAVGNDENKSLTVEVERDDASVGGVVLDLVRWIEVLDVGVHLSVSPDRRHHLVAYRMVSALHRC